MATSPDIRIIQSLPFHRLNVSQLRQELANQGIAIPSRLRKEELISLLSTYLTSDNGRPLKPFTGPLLEVFFTQFKFSAIPNIVIPISSSNNPYLLLPLPYLHAILNARDIDLQTSHFEELALRLSQFDRICPKYINQIASTPVNHLSLLSRLDLYLYGALHNLSLSQLPDLSKAKLCEVTQALVIFPGRIPRPPSRPFRGQKRVYVSTLDKLLELAQEGYTSPTPLSCLLPRELYPDLDEETMKMSLVTHPLRISSAAFSFLYCLSVSNLRHALRYLFGEFEDDIDFLSRNDILFTLSRGYFPDLPHLFQVKQRYQMLQTLSEDVKLTLIEIYGVIRFHNPLAAIAMTSPLPIEEVVIRLDHVPPTVLGEEIGMAIPQGVDPRIYFRNNVIHYQRVISRGNYVPAFTESDFLTQYLDLELYTDLELFTLLGVYINYSSRPELLRNLSRLRNEEMFFIPFSRKCRNTYTQLFTPTSDESVFIIAFGTLSNYVGYEIEELTSAFHFTEPSSNTLIQGDFVFLRPDNIREVFSVSQIKQLRDLLVTFSKFDVLIQKINEGLHDLESKTEYDRSLLSQLRTFSPEEMVPVKEYLDKIFELGMYMRRWKGPGHPYPLSEAQTRDNTLLPEKKTWEVLDSLEKKRQQMSPRVRSSIVGTWDKRTDTFFNGLRIVDYYGMTACQTSLSLSQLLHEVIKGAYCIRMASSRLISTSYYYLKLFFNESISNFHPSQVDPIS